MKVEIKDKKNNPIMKREEVMFSVEHDKKATPSRRELIKEIVDKLKSKEDLVIVDKIFSAKGRCMSNVAVLVYKKKDDIPKGKLEKMKRRMEKSAKKEKPKAEAKPIEEVKPIEGEKKEASVEEKTEKKEEVKTEEKKE
jgi:ribosomal protein S24E